MSVLNLRVNMITILAPLQKKKKHFNSIRVILISDMIILTYS